MILSPFMMTGCGDAVTDYDGPERAAVSGQVTLDGEPLSTGTISFVPEDSNQRAVTVGIGGGSYIIAEGSGPNLGSYQVKISSHQSSAEPQNDEEADYDEAAEGEDSELIETVPAKYNSETELTVKIESGANTHNFDLVSE